MTALTVDLTCRYEGSDVPGSLTVNGDLVATVGVVG